MCGRNCLGLNVVAWNDTLTVLLSVTLLDVKHNRVSFHLAELLNIFINVYVLHPFSRDHFVNETTTFRKCKPGCAFVLPAPHNNCSFDETSNLHRFITRTIVCFWLSSKYLFFFHKTIVLYIYGLYKRIIMINIFSHKWYDIY